MSPGPQRSPTEISLGELAHIPSNEDIGEGTSRSFADNATLSAESPVTTHDLQDFSAPPPEYTSPEGSLGHGSRRSSEGSDDDDDEEGNEHRDGRPLLRRRESPRPPIPSYDAAVGNEPRRTR